MGESAPSIFTEWIERTDTHFVENGSAQEHFDFEGISA